MKNKFIKMVASLLAISMLSLGFDSVAVSLPAGSTVVASSTDNPLPSEMKYPIDGIMPTTFMIVDISSGTSVSIKDLNVSLYKLDDYNRYAKRIEKLASWNTTDSESMTFDLPYHFENEQSSVSYGVVIENMPEDYVYSSGGKHDGCFPIPIQPITIWTDIEIGNKTHEHSYIIEIEKEGTEHHPVTSIADAETTDTTTTTLADDKTYQKGDVNMDGVVDVTDAQSALNIYADTLAGNTPQLQTKQIKAADVNADGKIDSTDAQLILLYYVQNTLADTPTTWEELLSRK